MRCKMLKSDIRGILLASLKHKNWVTRHSAVGAITELSKYDDLRDKILDSEIVVTLLATDREKDWRVRRQLSVLSQKS